MDNVKFIIGTAELEKRGLPIFSEQACNFLDALSKALLASKPAKAYPDLVAFAFWVRRANIQTLKKHYINEAPHRLGRGVCFHIAPSNIPINFAFSYVFSLLAGNANIVRLPSKAFPQVELFLGIMADVLSQHPDIAARTACVTYPRDAQATATFSKLADARMIWGGDATIAHVKTMPSKPRAIDIAFADRYSIAIIDGKEIAALDEAELTTLATHFYNDTYLMDQNACSSPQLIYWLHDSKAARKRFWQAVHSVASEKYELQDAIAVDKYTQACADAIAHKNISHITTSDNMLTRAELESLDLSVINNRGTGGYFYEYALSDVDELMSIITDKYQTITYFGIDADAVRTDLIEHNVRGIDRIVPIGKAMDIDVIWDGHDLIRELSRIVTVS